MKKLELIFILLFISCFNFYADEFLQIGTSLNQLLKIYPNIISIEKNDNGILFYEVDDKDMTYTKYGIYHNTVVGLITSKPLEIDIDSAIATFTSAIGNPQKTSEGLEWDTIAGTNSVVFVITNNGYLITSICSLSWNKY